MVDHRIDAAIDIGSNSILLTVAGPDGTILHDEARVVGLGHGLGDRGLFRDDRMDAARTVLRDYLDRALELGVPADRVQACATSGARRADNAAAFFSELQQEIGLFIRTISGDEEARLSYIGALSRLELPDLPVMVIDLGGGSTELAMGRQDRMAYRTSLEMGAVRLTERFHLDIDPSPQARKALLNRIHARLRPLILLEDPQLAIASAGTATTLAALELGLDTYDAEAVHGTTLSVDTLRGWAARFAACTPSERVEICRVSPKRAPYLIAGATVIAEVLEFVGLDKCTVSDGGLRFGILFADLDEASLN